MIECVNTPIRVYDEKLDSICKDDANWQTQDNGFQYMRLAMNIESLENYYKVY